MTCIQCGFLSLTLELGTPSTGAPFCPGPHDTVHSLRIQHRKGRHAARAEPGGQGGQLCTPTRAGTTHSQNITAAKLGTYHATQEPLPSTGQSQLTHSS